MQEAQFLILIEIGKRIANALEVISQSLAKISKE